MSASSLTVATVLNETLKANSDFLNHISNPVYAIEAFPDAEERLAAYLQYCEENKRRQDSKINAEGEVLTATTSTAITPATLVTQTPPSLKNFEALQKFIQEKIGEDLETEEEFKSFYDDKTKLNNIFLHVLKRLENERLRDLIALGVDVNTLFEISPKSRKISALELLSQLFFALDYELSFALDNKNSSVSLYFCTITYCIIDLILAGANIDPHTGEGYSFLDRLVQASALRIELLPLLAFVLSKNPDVNIVDVARNKMTPLHQLLYDMKLKSLVVDPKAFNGCIKLLMQGKEQDYSVNDGINGSIFAIVLTLLKEQKDAQIVEALNYIFENIRDCFLEEYSAGANHTYEDVATAAEQFVQSNISALAISSEARKEAREKFIASVLKTVEEDYAKGFGLSRVFIKDTSYEDYLIPVIWKIVQQYFESFESAFIERGYQVGKHLALPKETTAHTLATLVPSVRIVTTSMAVIQNIIVTNAAFNDDLTDEAFLKQSNGSLVFSSAGDKTAHPWYQFRRIESNLGVFGFQTTTIKRHYLTLQPSIQDPSKTVICHLSADMQPDPITYVYFRNRRLSVGWRNNFGMSLTLDDPRKQPFLNSIPTAAFIQRQEIVNRKIEVHVLHKIARNLGPFVQEDACQMAIRNILLRYSKYAIDFRRPLKHLDNKTLSDLCERGGFLNIKAALPSMFETRLQMDFEARKIELDSMAQVQTMAKEAALKSTTTTGLLFKFGQPVAERKGGREQENASATNAAATVTTATTITAAPGVISTASTSTAATESTLNKTGTMAIKK